MSRCDENDATDPPPPIDVRDACLLYGAEAIDIEPLNEDPPLKEAFSGGFRDIFSLKERRGRRTASNADFLTHTFVPLLLLLHSDLIVGAAVVELFLRCDLETSELVLTSFEL